MEKEAKWLLSDKYNGVSSPAFKADLKRLDNGEPLAYVIGWIPFLNTKIYLDSHPLIPRPETEFWVAQAIEEIKKHEKENIKVLDLCAGSGCIGVAIMKAFPQAEVHFAEIDERHHETIAKNIRENNLRNQKYRIIGGSLFENVNDLYDVILTNPPYIDPKLSDRIEDSVHKYEPDIALFGGTDGMELVAKIIKQAPGVLVPGGFMYVEHEPEQKTAIHSLSGAIESYEDQYGVIRFSVLKN